MTGDARSLTTPDLAGFDEQRAELLSVLGVLARAARDRDDGELAGELRAAAGRLEEGRFTLLVLGEFKRGKSTLINALLGCYAMPVGVIPVTSLPVSVEYGPELAVEYRTQGGEPGQGSVEELDRLVTERGNQGNRLGLESVRVTAPAEILQHGLILVDTPGIGSVHEHNTAATYRHLRHADAAIFMLSVDPPATDQEISFLRDVRDEVGQLFFVLNKADLLSAAELDEALGFVKEVLEEQAGIEQPSIFPLSARSRDERFDAFRAALEEFLSRERGAALLERGRQRAVRALRQELMAIDVEERALDLSRDELERRLDQLRQKVAEVKRRRDDQEGLLAAEVQKASGELEQAIDQLRESGTGRVRQAIEQASRQSGGFTAEALGQALRDELHAVMWEGMAAIERDVGQRIAAASARFTGEANRLAGDVLELSAELFEVELPPVEAVTGLSEDSRFDFLLDEQLPGLEVLRLGARAVLPGPLRRRVVLRDALHEADELVDRHCGRLRYDVASRLDRQHRALRRQLTAALESAQATVERAVGLAQSTRRQGEAVTASTRDRLRERRQSFVELGQRLPGSLG